MSRTSNRSKGGVPAVTTAGNLAVFDAQVLSHDTRLDGWIEHPGEHLASFDFHVSGRQPFWGGWSR